MKTLQVLQAGRTVFTGRKPSLSIEITRECPLACPGCYAYDEKHLGGDVLLRQVSDYRGQELIDRTLDLVDQHRPMHVSIVGGEPLVRFRELGTILPEISRRGAHVQVVTSAVRQIPPEWAAIPNLSITVSIDGLQPDHDERRKPATYERILQSIQGHRIVVHCTITRQVTRRPGYLEEFLTFWSRRTEVRKIWFSLFTPQIGEVNEENLPPDVRGQVLDELEVLAPRFPKLELPKGMIEAYRKPPADPGDCVFAKTTTCFTADLKQLVTPCQFGGTPDCSQCGCVASAGMTAIARHRLPGGIRVGTIFDASYRVGQAIRAARAGSTR